MSTTYTHPDVFTLGVAEGWAEAEDDPTHIDWRARRAAAAIPFRVRNRRPVNPCERTKVRHGRNELGLWGENLMADALVTAVRGGGRHLLMIERRDGLGWAVPGGSVEPGESGLQAALRELAEETRLNVAKAACRVMPARYVPDPRASDEAWAVTVPVHASLGAVRKLPEVAAGDDALRADWVAATSFGWLVAVLQACCRAQVFAAHQAMLAEFLG
jgi:ADP-ribose pyrophosphatase